MKDSEELYVNIYRGMVKKKETSEKIKKKIVPNI